MPAAPVANTKLPALLTYAGKPSVTAVYESGERIAFPIRQGVAQVVAGIQDSAGKSKLPPGGPKLVEVGLPSDILRSAEIGSSRWPPGVAGVRHGIRDLDDSGDAGLA